MSFLSRDSAPLKLLSVCRDEYFRMKVQWKSVSEEQEMRNSLLRGYRSLIGQHRRTFHPFSELSVRAAVDVEAELCLFVLWQREMSAGRTDTIRSSLGTTIRAWLCFMMCWWHTACTTLILVRISELLGPPRIVKIKIFCGQVTFRSWRDFRGSEFTDISMSPWHWCLHPSRLRPGDERSPLPSPVCHSERGGVLLVSDRLHGAAG